jgi:hypothetical protein
MVPQSVDRNRFGHRSIGLVMSTHRKRARPKLRGTKEEHKRASPTGAKAIAVKATWHVKLTRGDHTRTAFTDYVNRVPKRRAIETLHVDGERVKLRIDVVQEQPRARWASLGVFDVLATEVD